MPSEGWLKANRDHWRQYLRDRYRRLHPPKQRHPTLAERAAALGISKRTLQRRLVSGLDPATPVKRGRPSKQVGILILPGETRQQACKRLGISERTWFRRQSEHCRLGANEESPSAGL